MSTLTDFLNEKAKQLEELAPQRQQRIAEWTQAVERLLRQLEGWLREADKPQVLAIEPITVQRREAGLGVYTAGGLKISLDGIPLEIVPRARQAVGRIRKGPSQDEARIEGMVEINSGGYKVYLYRLAGEQGDEWYTWEDPTQPARLFDRNQFEQLMVGLL
jgi:hypothetical protein